MAITDKLKEVANSIREKTNTTELMRIDQMRIDQMDELIESISGSELPDYQGEYVVSPGFEPITLDTDEKSMRENVLIQPISVNEVSNPSNGKTLII